MLEKLAEVVREQGIISGAEYDDKSKKIELSLCLQVESPVTINADITNPISAEQKVAQWAVLLLVEGIRKKYKEYLSEAEEKESCYVQTFDEFIRHEAIINLIIEVGEVKE